LADISFSLRDERFISIYLGCQTAKETILGS
jgi:hypothetical protein